MKDKFTKMIETMATGGDLPLIVPDATPLVKLDNVAMERQDNNEQIGERDKVETAEVHDIEVEELIAEETSD